MTSTRMYTALRVASHVDYRLVLLRVLFLHAVSLGGIVLAAQAIPPIGTHFFVAWSVCRV